MNPTIPSDLLELKDRFEAWRINPRRSEARASGPFLLFSRSFPASSRINRFLQRLFQQFPKR
jgi:hypothetical protein